ncbi:MAG: DUF2178 domain-containing protein [Candidatus Hadarchaeum sp.]|uniref:DUF2178 domain-containing protein n=1 Tax=Candidatus Hadarchaeum sp. TaxID=2883567 RepID=UPI003D0A7224
MMSGCYTSYKRAVMAIVASLVAFSAFTGELLIAVLSVVVGLLFLYLLKSKTDEVLVDERAYKISEKASRRTIQVVGLASAVVGISMVGLSRVGHPELLEAGLSLAYFSAVLMLVYLLFYRYYAKKFGD